MSVTAPPRPPRPGDPVDRDELEALVEALIEEARRRARRRRLVLASLVGAALLAGVGVFVVFDRTAHSQGSSPGASARPAATAAATNSRIAGDDSSVRQDSITGIVACGSDSVNGATPLAACGSVCLLLTLGKIPSPVAISIRPACS